MLLAETTDRQILLSSPAFPAFFKTIPFVFPVKVTYKKSSKTYTKSLKSTITVKNPTLTLSGATTLDIGATDTITAVAKPSSAKVTFTSSDDSVVTVDANGVVTGVKAGTATITATAKYGKKTVTKTQIVTVKEAALSAVKQTASNAFTAEFTSDASKKFTKDDIAVAATDGSSVLAVKSVEYSADGKSAKVTVFGNFTNDKAYKVTCKDVTLDMTAKVGAVARVAINTASAQQNVETPIDFTLFDADGIDVTPSVSLDTTCTITVTGDYSAASVDKASTAKITMNTVKAEAEVTVTYNSNEKGAQDITATQKITCVDATATQGDRLFATATNEKVNQKNGCAKFYLGLSDTSVSVEEGSTPNNDVYFCAKSKGDVVSYDSYDVESSNDDIVSATLTKDSGKYAHISVTGNTVGSAQLNIKATKNGKDTYYTIPVTVTKPAEANSMTVEVTDSTMSNVNDSDYYGTVKAQLYDKDGNKVAGTYSYEIVTKATSGAGLSFDAAPVAGSETLTSTQTDEDANYYAQDAQAKTYTIEVKGADANTGKTITKRISVTVKALPNTTNGKYALTYQIKLDRNTVNENPLDRSDDSVTAKLYATYNNLFAGYVRESGSTVTVAEGNITPATALTDVKVAAKFGTGIYNTTNGLVTPAGSYETLSSSVGQKYDAVDATSNTVKYTPDYKNQSNLAKTGVYTIEYRLYTDTDKYTSRTQTVNVKNDVTVPTVSVTSRKADSLTFADIVKGLKTSVDMNSDVSDYDSIVNNSLFTDTNDTVAKTNNNGDKMTVKYVEVIEDYKYSDGTVITWNFYVPINTTFTAQ